MERELGIAKAREKFGDLVEQVQYQGDTIIINRNGKPAAAVVPMEVYENWKRQRKEFFAVVRQMQQRPDVDPNMAEKLANEAITAIRKQSRTSS